MSLYLNQNQSECPFTTKDSWVILSKIEQSIKRKIESVGTPLKDWKDIKIYRGVLTGCNEAFIISTDKRISAAILRTPVMQKRARPVYTTSLSTRRFSQ